VSNRALNLPQVKYSLTNCGGGVTQGGVSYPGGLDLVTPSLRLQPGAVRAASNFEAAQSGGYSRIVGYERVDGRAAPSSATYQVVQVGAFINIPAVGDVLSQPATASSGTIIAVVTTPVPYVAVTLITGGFNTFSDVVTPGPLPIGTATARTATINAETDAQYTAAAADVYRALIGPVPGSGPMRGVVGQVLHDTVADNLFAFRDNAGGTAVAIYKTSPAGWVLVPFFNLVNFTGGTAAPADGDTLTQGGVTATIKRVMWQSGSYSGGTAVGGLVITDPSGGNFAAGAATSSGGGAFTLSGAQAPISPLPGGDYEFVRGNFSGQLSSQRIYGADGVNPPFEFDGETYAPIATGLSPNTPDVIAFHKNYLFVAQESSMIHCGAGTQFKWSSVDGGGEIATGDHVHELLTLPGNQTTAALGVYMHSNTGVLYGTDPTTFNFVVFNTGQGALMHSVQNLADAFLFDTLGVVTMRTTLNWGNFSSSTLTQNLLPFIIQERDKLSASCIFREKSSYRVFFNDGYGLWITTINQQYLGAMPVLFPNPVACCDESVNTMAQEVIYFGSTDDLGYVYQMERGTSFDGAPIDAYITLAWDPLKSPRILKRFRAGSIEVQGDGYAAIQFGYSLAYGSRLVGQPAPVSTPTNFTPPPVWDEFVWDEFIWDGQTLQPTDVDMTGTAESVQVTISSGTNYVTAYTIDSVIYQYSMRRGIRV
jgi:hypothetical protein